MTNRGLKIAFLIGLAIAALFAWGHWVFHRGCAGFVLWLFTAFAFAGLMVWSFVRADQAPDRLAELGLVSFERDGLCFSFAPVVDAGLLWITVVYQNRHASPCRADILLRPKHGAGEAGLKRLRCQLTCQGAGSGTVRVPWAIPHQLQGQRIMCMIGADVEFPDGPGRMVRFKDAIKVGSREDAEGGTLTELFADHPHLEVDLPVGVATVIPPSMVPTTLVLDPECIESPDPTALASAAAAGLEPAPSVKVEASRAVPPNNSSELSEDRVGELLNSLMTDSGLKAHRLAVREAKSQRFGEDVERYVVLLLVSTAIAGLGAYFFFNERHSLKVILAALVGTIGVFASLFGLAAGIPKAIRRPTSQSAGGLREACMGYYSHVLSRVSDEHGFFVGACEYFPLPVLRRYVARSESLTGLEERWREVREELAALEYSIHLDGMNITEQPRSDPRVVDLVVHFRSERHGQVSVRNVAFHLDGQWFLATPEPVRCDAS